MPATFQQLIRLMVARVLEAYSAERRAAFERRFVARILTALAEV